MNRKKRLILQGGLTLLWTAVIFLFSLQPAKQSASLSGGLLQALLGWIYAVTTVEIPIALVHNLFRKMAHFAEFLVLGMFSGAFSNSLLEKRSPALIYGGAIALLDETLQFITGEGRAMRFSDMLIDFSGVLVAVGLLTALSKFSAKTKKGVLPK
ncbi:MAG: VanZ family protein [Clostridia bacterium]|nr:VanZ family protein [Clostridia bacterium]